MSELDEIFALLGLMQLEIFMSNNRSIINVIGQLQFKYPILSKPINLLAKLAVGRGVGRIRYGVGAGLMINAKGCNPGFLFGTSEPREQRLLAECLSEGQVFYDCGANAGFYCILAARLVGTTGRVYGFEPTPTLAARISENAKRNSFDNIEVVESAVCQTSGTIEFGVSGDLSVENSISSAAGDRSVRKITVQTTSIDDFARNHRPPNVIMIDIEGAELDALAGGLETIKKFKPTLLVEVHWLGQRFSEFIQRNLVPLGYEVTDYDGSPIPSEPLRFHCLLRAEK